MRHLCKATIAFATSAVLLASPAQVTGQVRGLTISEPATTRGTFGRYHAILFAVGEQAATSDLPSLRFPISEADSLRSVLLHHYTFDSIDVRVVRNPTRDQIVDALDALAAVLGPQDNLLVVYSGHGYYDRDGQEGYWQAADAHNKRKSSWLANSEVRTVMRKLRARQVLVVTDACFSGALTRGGSAPIAEAMETYEFGARLSRRTSRHAITAGSFDEPVPAASVFAVELVKTLRGNRGDVMTAARLAYMIRPAVAAVAHTTVQYGSFAGVADEQGEFVFVSRTAQPRQVAASAPEERTTPVPSRETVATASRTAPDSASHANRTVSRVTPTIIGCWRYPNGILVRMMPDGSVTGAPFAATWTAAPDRRFLVRWPHYVDRVVLANDGLRLTGANNFGQPFRATRNGAAVTDRRSLSGSWTYNTIPAVAAADGSIVAGPFTGKWRLDGDGSFVVEWTHTPVDDFAISSDGSELKGSNNLGMMFSAARATCRE